MTGPARGASILIVDDEPEVVSILAEILADDAHLVETAYNGLAALDRNGLRYPVPPYGIQADAGAGLAVSYAAKETKTP